MVVNISFLVMCFGIKMAIRFKITTEIMRNVIVALLHFVLSIYDEHKKYKVEASQRNMNIPVPPQMILHISSPYYSPFNNKREDGPIQNRLGKSEEGLPFRKRL
jgi:hypothetical protein